MRKILENLLELTQFYTLRKLFCYCLWYLGLNALLLCGRRWEKLLKERCIIIIYVFICVESIENAIVRMVCIIYEIKFPISFN